MRASRDRGAAAIEFALVIPVLITFLFGIVEGGTRYAQQNQVNHWAFLAARDLSIDPNKDATAIVAGLKGSDVTAYTVSATPSTKCAAPGASQVKVVVTTTKNSPTGLFGTYTITGKGLARCEN